MIRILTWNLAMFSELEITAVWSKITLFTTKATDFSLSTQLNTLIITPHLANLSYPRFSFSYLKERQRHLDIQYTHKIYRGQGELKWNEKRTTLYLWMWITFLLKFRFRVSKNDHIMNKNVFLRKFSQLCTLITLLYFWGP